MKLSGREKAFLIISLFCVFQNAYAQDTSKNPDQAPVEGAGAVAEQEQAEPPREYARVLHIEKPIPLAQLERQGAETFSQQFAAAQAQASPVADINFSQLTPEQQVYLDRLKDIDSFDQVLEDLEIEGGAWSMQIAQELTSLGDLLQAQGDHQQAIEIYDRAVHINRVNDGLFSTGQVPLVERIVNGHVALGQWQEADDRKQYAFYVQTRAFSIDDPRMIDVFDNLARWNIASFYRGIDENPGPRLLQTYLLYRTATESVATHFGTKDPRYLELLRKEAGAADMLNRYSLPGEAIGTRMNPELRLTSEFIGESTRPRGRNNGGQRALERIVDYYSDPKLPPTDETKIARAVAVAELADWYLIADRRQAAMRTYEEAYNLLAYEENSEELLYQVFGEVVFIPTYSNFDAQRMEAYGVGPDSGARMGYVDIAFDVNQYGRLNNFEVLDLVPEELSRADIQVLNSIRSTLVRPKLRDGKTVSSDMERFRFNFWY